MRGIRKPLKDWQSTTKTEGRKWNPSNGYQKDIVKTCLIWFSEKIQRKLNKINIHENKIFLFPPKCYAI